MATKDEAIKMAIEAWDNIDTTNQSNVECARNWFIEGYVQALEQPEPFIAFNQKEWMNQIALTYKAGYDHALKEKNHE